MFRLGLPPHLSWMPSGDPAYRQLVRSLRRWMEPYVGPMTVVSPSRYTGNASAIAIGTGAGGVNWDFVQTWWDALDNVTRTALTALGYTPDALTDGVTALDDGEPGFILAFLEDLETVV